MTDNGGEFSSDKVREVASILNVRLITTAADSPLQNGLCERVHSVTNMVLLKLMEENKRTESQILLSWANMERNSLQMWNGFSSHQPVFGKKSKFTRYYARQTTSTIGTTSSDIFAQHLNVLHNAWRAYIQTEANERIRRALRTKVRAAEQINQNGDTVFYNREGKERWLGPASVVFQDGKNVFVRHGGMFVRVSPNRLSKVQDMKSQNKIEHNDTESYSKHSDGVAGKIVRKVDTRVSEPVPAPAEVPEENNTNMEGTEIDREAVKSRPIKINDVFRYKVDNEWITGTIMSHAGKATGKYKTWYNIKNDNNEERSIDIGSLEWEMIPETEINMAAVSDNMGSKDKDIIMAKENDFDKQAEFGTYEEVVNSGQKTLSTRWVITTKDRNTKARLVVRGFQEKDLEIPRDSPTVGKGAMRLYLSIAALQKWTVKTTDIKSALLQGKELDRDIYINPLQKVRHHSILCGSLSMVYTV